MRLSNVSTLERRIPKLTLQLTVLSVIGARIAASFDEIG